jgi:hypothetical protein
MKARITPILSIVFLSGLLGFASAEFHFFPYQIYLQANHGYWKIKEYLSDELPWYYQRSSRQQTTEIVNANAIQPGLSLVTGIGPNNHSQATVIDASGRVIHNWQLNWFELWPDATHLAQYDYKELPGPHTHGVILMDNGDLIFSLERAGLFRIDPCGHVVWRLAKRTHHSLFLDDNGDLWVPSLEWQETETAERPGYKPPYKDFKILKVSTDGELINEWSLFDILKANHLERLMYMSTQANFDMDVSGDTLHLNDIEIFPSTMPPGIFEPGDIMLSLRNVHSVLILNKDLTLKRLITGSFIRQHDPDFIDGNTISLFDNATHTAKTERPYSRIIEIKADTNKESLLYQGSKEKPFFTAIMGKHQRLLNGNILVTETVSGRAFELKGEAIVWQYFNVLPNQRIGFIDEVQRLPTQFNKEFFEQQSALCSIAAIKDLNPANNQESSL